MKIFKLYIVLLILTSIISCGKGQGFDNENQIESMLLDFYTKHFQLWKIPALRSDERFKKLDSLMQKFCTLKIRNEAKEVFNNIGADYITNDLIGNTNENLKVEKDKANKNVFIVSFTSDVATYTDISDISKKKNILLYVTVVKIGTDYKIDSIR